MILRIATTLTLCALVAPHALAERADRDKPMQLEANRISIDDAKKIQILEGDVIITKGTMILKADRVVVTEDKYGFQKGTAFSGKDGLARFRQKREGKEEYVDGEAERIEYDTNKEVAELFHRAWVRSGEDQVKGDYIWYDAVSEKYLVTAGESSNPKGPPARVRAVIQPKSKGTQPETNTSRGDRLELKGAGGLQAAPIRE
ncbi:lipopolysaccharide transport periplasmic protein LptA [Dechloromonas denitrificans]|uniref:lipopolysaccharide transport periplasmic protein LptA n=1 Tax=Dechloromonas denitrificans TaxID=281362 RepID=UPI001CF85E32|nr:lipopolysaccharide transport periplasmic protein LptA [Dechloromonas denitrificans]UCV11051.1 lipopolysaccharide transport periplasmic protein LptA [Dechloromonas denitrificans]